MQLYVIDGYAFADGSASFLNTSTWNKKALIIITIIFSVCSSGKNEFWYLSHFN